MHPRSTLAALAWALLTTLAPARLLAQPADVPPPPRLSETPARAAPAPAATAAPAAAASAPADKRSAPRATPPSNVRVIEDDDVRIEEVRGPRGDLQRITVYSKTTGLKAYEVIVGPAGRDALNARGGATGQRGWSILDF
jgi:hypothetical protein